MKNILLVANDNPIDPLGLMYLIGNVNANFDVLFIKDIDDKRIYNKDISKYDIIGFSTITGSHKLHNKIAKYFKLKNNNILTIMGGPHPTFFPKESLQLSHIDYICIGEGIVALNNFINGKHTNNIINDYTKFNNCLDTISNINSLNIDRHVIYSMENRGNNPIKNFMGTFGCPYNCSYCFNESYEKIYKHQSFKRVRYVNPDKFIEQIKYCVDNYNTKFIYIQDDTFILNKKWWYEVVDKIKGQLNLPYHCHIRCDIVNEETIKKLKETGCKSVTFAIENSNYEYRKKYLNRRMTNEQILNTSKLLHKYNILFRIENMVGLPLNTLKDNINTLKLNYKCKPTIGWASLFQPFPNTKLGELCLSKKLWDGNIDTINPSFFDKSSINIKNKKQIEKLQKIFSLGVNNYYIKLLIPLLIKLPLDKLYKKIYTKFKNNKYNKLYHY